MILQAFTILHIEDDPDDILLVHDAFAEVPNGHRLEVAQDGEEALAYLCGRGAYADRHAHPFPSLILLDLKLPRKSGLEVLEWLRHRPETKRIPVVVLTSSENLKDVERAYDLGVNSYLVKPVDYAALGAMVKSIAAYWIKLNRNPGVVV
jgi:CheY-like chemotaxis protein